MTEINNAAILVNYDFPPNNGIGGRRWAKLAKGLADLGTKVHVIKAAPWPGEVDSPWSEDVDHPNIRVYELPHCYPQAVAKPRGSLIGRLAYRFWIKFLLFRYRGTVYDKAIGWAEEFERAVEDILARFPDVTALIGTGAPFNLLYYCAKAKRRHPDLVFLADFRDPWLGASNYGMECLSAARLQNEKDKCREVLGACDRYTAPNKFLLNEIAVAIGETHLISQKGMVIPHFYDDADFPHDYEQRSDNEIRVVYGGTFYGGRQALELVELLDSLQAERPKLYSRLRITFYTQSAEGDLFARHADVVAIRNPVGRGLFRELAESDIALVLLPDRQKNYLTTKLIDYLPHGKPIMLFAAEGFVSRWVEENRLGVWIESGVPDFERLLALDVSASDFDTSEFSLCSIAEKVEAILV